MDTESNQKARRFTKRAWCERGKDNPRKKVSRRSQEAGQAGPAGAAGSDTKKVEKINSKFGIWALAAVLFLVLFLIGVM